jgi:Family of unknown function (DUF6510)
MKRVSRSTSDGKKKVKSAADASRLDGNAAAGMLSELFVPDLTRARAKCAGCGATESIGALLVYAHGMGLVVRCCHCDSVVLRLSHTPTHVWLDAKGATSIAIPC